MKRFFRIFTIVIFAVCGLGIVTLLIFPVTWGSRRAREDTQPRIVVPRTMSARAGDIDNQAEIAAREDAMSARVPFADWEVIISVLTGHFDGSVMESQFIAYYNLLEIESPIYLTFVDYNPSSNSYRRAWTAASSASRPGTINLYTIDLLGDRSLCVLLSGVNYLGEHTLTVFRRNASLRTSSSELFSKIADIRIDGSISVREGQRSQAYQYGMSRGEPFTIVGHGRDFDSYNILDQVEITYIFNPASGVFEQQNRARIPGFQVEQRRVRDILGNRQNFEDFIGGLWYHVSPQGDINRDQYVYFDQPNRQIIFFGDETQQIFNWRNSINTRYGLFISSQNISISSLRRSIDLELESLESIRIRVIEDRRINLGVSAPWDGSYRKAGPPQRPPRAPAREAFINASYDGPIGKMQFFPDGAFDLRTAGATRQGRYAFFNMNEMDLLELRSNGLRSNETRSEREVYLIEDESDRTLSLMRVRIGVRGVERLNEGLILLTLAE
ncbi:MAG: pallilysin-related adhesin [Treponema sp.]|nr:pallilysin-related adhesin [Treponema sp.]